MHPTKLKMAKIIPFLKMKITLTQTTIGLFLCCPTLIGCSKNWSSLECPRVESFIEQNDILSPSQYGLCKAHSTQHAILDIVSTIQQTMGKSLFSCGVFIDLKRLLIQSIIKLFCTSSLFCRVINKWFSSYLEGRTQTTQIGSYISKRKNTTCGVPQGSVLGPLLFLIYVNDIQESSDKLNFFYLLMTRMPYMLTKISSPLSGM